MSYSTFVPSCSLCKGTRIQKSGGVAICLTCGYEEDLSSFNARNNQDKQVVDHYIEEFDAKFSMLMRKPENTVSQEEYDELARELSSVKADLEAKIEETEKLLSQLTSSNIQRTEYQSQLELLKNDLKKVQDKNAELEERILNEALNVTTPFSVLYKGFAEAKTVEEREKFVVPLAAIVRNYVEDSLIHDYELPHTGRDFIADYELLDTFGIERYRKIISSAHQEKTNQKGEFVPESPTYKPFKNIIEKYISKKNVSHCVPISDNEIFIMAPQTRYILAGIDKQIVKQNLDFFVAPTDPKFHLKKSRDFHYVLNNCIHAGDDGMRLREIVSNDGTNQNPLLKAIEFFKQYNLFNPEEC